MTLAGAARFDLATISVLWRRDMMRFWRQPSRLVGALGQPIIFWLIIGGGMAASFHIPNSSVGYLEYFYPGVVLMVALFSSIFASVSLIEDRHQGFLQAVLAGPGSRFALVLGKCLGSATVALVQVAAFLALAPLAGFAWAGIDWLLLASALLLTCVGLSALGFAVAWGLDNVQAYHAVQMTLLVPLWVISGAMFPAGPQSAAVFQWALRLNPVAYSVGAVRHAFYGGQAPGTSVVEAVGPAVGLACVAAFAVVCLIVAVAVCRRR